MLGKGTILRADLMEPEGYRAAVQQAALADVSAWGKLIFRGPDRNQFLQGLLTSDVQNLKPWHGQATCVLTPRSKLVANFMLYDAGEELLSIQQPQATARIVEALSKPLTLSQTVIKNMSDQWAAFLMIGPQAPNVLKDVLDVTLPSPDACLHKEWEEKSLFALPFPTFSQNGSLLLVEKDASKRFLSVIMDNGKVFGLEQLSAEALEVLRVEAGIPSIGIDTDEDTLPLELPLEHAISFSKGCYMGQETTARIKNFGHVNRKFVGLRLQAAASPGSIVLAQGKTVGKITSIVASPKLQAFLALGLIQRDFSEPATHVTVADNDHEVSAEVVSL